MVTQKILTHKIDAQKCLDGVSSWNISPTMKNDVLNFFEDYSVGKVTRRIGTNSPASVERNLSSLKVGLENLKGFTKKDLEDFLGNLFKDKIKTRFNKPYSLKSKKEAINILVRFVNWKGLDSSPLKLIIGNKESNPPYLTEEEILQLYEGTDNPKYKYFIAVLYSSGARAEEFYNIRISDITLPKGEENFVKLTLRNEFSKTHGRTISLFWKPSLEAVRDYLNLRIEEGAKPEDAVFPITYLSMRKWLQRHGKKILGKSVNHHLFRHSLATHHNSNRGFSREQMSVFFGWDFSSKMLDRYCNRNAVDFKVVENRFKSVNNEEMKNRIDQITRAVALLSKQNEIYSRVSQHLTERDKEEIFEKNKEILIALGGKEVPLIQK